MKIFGIGTDIVNINRIHKSIKKNGTRFKHKIFSKNEMKYCDNKKNPRSFYAKRFAAKEAFSKALGTGIRKEVKLKNIEVSNDSSGKPSLNIKGSTLTYLNKKLKNKNYKIYLSLSDDFPWAQATVIISHN
ncbi:MAG: holo-[acyl-carrier protein] synthase [Pelagibacterales bacterium]|nr:holo-[acyl-carrier protein] synthase [Pelagibacterales bacterium]